MLLEKIETLLQEVGSLTAKNADEVEQLRLKYLSKKGEINALMADFRNVAADQKKNIGIKIRPKPTTLTSLAQPTPSHWAHATL